jgi:integrase
VVWDHGRVVSSRTFATKKEAKAYEAAEKARLAATGGVANPKAGRMLVSQVLPLFREHRRSIIQETTQATEQNLLEKASPAWLLHRSIGSITSRDVERALVERLAAGAAYASMKRYRDALAALMNYAVEFGYIAASPMTRVALPKRKTPKTPTIRPWTYEELMDRYAVWVGLNRDFAEALRFMGLTACRWEELRELRCKDIRFEPFPSVLISRAHPEHGSIKGTKTDHIRRVPLMDELLPYVRERLETDGKPDDLLFGPLWRTSIIRSLHWAETGQGRTIYDLRHTGICIFIREGLDLASVRAYAGHESLRTTSIYVSVLGLGTEVDRLALAKLNAKAHATNSARTRGEGSEKQGKGDAGGAETSEAK